MELLQRELAHVKQSNKMLTSQLEESMMKLDAFKNLDNLEDDKRLLVEYQERIIELETESSRQNAFQEGNTKQIDELKAQIKHLIAKDQETALKYQQTLDSTEDLKLRLTSQLECELSEQQELRTIITNLEKELERQRMNNQQLNTTVQQKEQLIQEMQLRDDVHSKWPERSVLMITVENSLETQKRLSDHWRVTIAQEREKFQEDRTRYEKERESLLAQLEEERENNTDQSIHLQAQLSILQLEIENQGESTQDITKELHKLSDSLASKISELTDLYNQCILRKSVPNSPTKPQQSKENETEVTIGQVAQSLKGQTAVLTELSYSAFRALQSTLTELHQRKEQRDDNTVYAVLVFVSHN